MAEEDLRRWTGFFNEAGVPRGPATEYATLFCNHRIKENLLGDLSKEILNDIGITVMGDIMSILKHAKTVYAKLEREKLSNRLIPEAEPTTAVEEPSPFLSSQQSKKKKTVVKLVSRPKTPEVQQTKVLPTVSKKMLIGNSKVTVNTNNATATVPQKRPIKNTLTLSERFAGETVVPPKVSRELSPLTATNLNLKTKKPLQKEQSAQAVSQGQKTDPPKRRSAFERLGKEPQSAQKGTDILTSKVKITNLAKSPQNGTSSTLTSRSKGESSVFKRLGDTESKPSGSKITTMTIRTVPGLGSRVVSDESGETHSESAGILNKVKPTRAVKPVKPVSPVNTIIKLSSSSTDKKSSPEKMKAKKSVFSRLGSPTY